MLTSLCHVYSAVTLKDEPFCIILPSFFSHAKNQPGCSSALWYIDGKRSNLTKVTSKTTTSDIGQL